MAKATATCRCATCGETFEVTETKANRGEADRWKEWAENHYDQCKKCWIKEQREIEEATPLTVTIGCEPFSQKIVICFAGNTMPVKDRIKSLGYRWTDSPAQGWLGMFATTRSMCWNKEISPEKIDDELKQIENEFPEIVMKNNIAPMDMMAFKKIGAEKEKKQKQIDEEVAKLEKPQKPFYYPNSRWNGTVYGKNGNHAVYINGKKTPITDKEAAEIERYQTEMAEYNKKIDEIKNAVETAGRNRA